MSPDQVAAKLLELLGETATASVAGSGSSVRGCVDVPPEQWVSAAEAARDKLGLTFFDWLTGVDEEDAGYAIVAHLWSPPERFGVLLRTHVSRADPHLASLTGVFAGANWHERETFEMFGVVFDGHPNLKKLLLPDEFEGHPLRKDFVLVARVARPWPGEKEPEEREQGAPTRRKIRPPGVPDPAEWGPGAAASPEPSNEES